MCLLVFIVWFNDRSDVKLLFIIPQVIIIIHLSMRKIHLVLTCLLLKIKLYFRIVLNLQKSGNDSTDSSVYFASHTMPCY